MFNPRWPHTFTIIPEYLDENGIPVTDENGDPCEPTPPTPEPELDENGLPLTDENGDPISTPAEEQEPQDEPEDEGGDEPTPEPEPVEPPKVKIVLYDGKWNPRYNASGAFQTKEVSQIPWGYRTATGGIKESGEVIVADYKISCPMLLTEIPTGTCLTMTDYTHTFRVKVVKQTTYNWGTNIWVDNIKN